MTEKQEYLQPEGTNLLVVPEPVVEGTVPAIKPTSGEIQSGIIVALGLTSKQNLRTGMIVYFKGSLGTTFLDGPKKKTLVLIDEDDVIATRREIEKPPVMPVPLTGKRG